MTIIMIPSYLSLTSMHRACQISEVSFLQWTLIYRSPSPHSAFRSNPPLLFKCLLRNIKPRISIDKKYNCIWHKDWPLICVSKTFVSWLDTTEFGYGSSFILSKNELCWPEILHQNRKERKKQDCSIYTRKLQRWSRSNQLPLVKTAGAVGREITNKSGQISSS